MITKYLSLDGGDFYFIVTYHKGGDSNFMFVCLFVCLFFGVVFVASNDSAAVNCELGSM
jgi:hypothetical protein